MSNTKAAKFSQLRKLLCSVDERLWEREMVLQGAERASKSVAHAVAHYITDDKPPQRLC